MVRKLPKVNAKLAARLLEESKTADGQAMEGEGEGGEEDGDEDEEEGGRGKNKKVKKKQKAALAAAKALSDPRFAALFKDEVRGELGYYVHVPSVHEDVTRSIKLFPPVMSRC